MAHYLEPLELAVAIAERFMKIHPPPRTYMYHFGLLGLLHLWEATREQRYLDFYLAAKGAAGGKEPVFDWFLYSATGDRRWVDGAAEVGERLLADPRRDRDGALLDPRGRYTVDVLSYYFSMPITLGHVLKDGRYFDEAERQYRIYRDYLEEPQTGAWYSRWGHFLHPNRPNPGLWARGNGWLVNAWGRTMHLWDPKHRAYEFILSEWRRFCRSLAAFQTPSGLFRQLLNRPDCFEEATGSGLFCSGFAEGVRHGTLPAEFATVAYRTFCGLRELIDKDGNIHNVSTYAGGYNFERQYYSCARFNEPHGDGSVMGACVAVHHLLKEDLVPDRTPPSVRPQVITTAVPHLLTSEPPQKRHPDDIAPPVVERVMTLDAVPEHDPFGMCILGLLHWHDYRKETAALDKARRLLERSAASMEAATMWKLTAELEALTGQASSVKDRQLFLDARLSCSHRDRYGTLLDEFGGYSVERLFALVPLLARTGAETGQSRYFDEACLQLLSHKEWLEEPVSHLWHSAWGRGAHSRRATPGLWALGNAYAVAATVELLEHLPPQHPRYIDVVCYLRRHVEALHEYLPVGGGWLQVMDRLDSFACTAATGLMTYATSRAILRGWVSPAYLPVATGGADSLGELVDRKGIVRFSSPPFGGLDTVEAYQEHRLENDASALGHVLSGCAWAAMCMRAVPDPSEDGTLGAR
mgnify:CR=1 FL=1